MVVEWQDKSSDGWDKKMLSTGMDGDYAERVFDYQLYETPFILLYPVTQAASFIYKKTVGNATPYECN